MVLSSIIEAIEAALATAYKKEYGKKGQIIRATFDLKTGGVEFFQVKIVVDKSSVIFEDELNELEIDSPEAAEAQADERDMFSNKFHF